jgi:protein-S-isoprenylcysteine O-methyltransferase Ste14
MRATELEYKNRFWVIGIIFGLTFWLFGRLDHSNLAESLVRALRPELNPDSLDYRCQLQGAFVAGAVLVFIAAQLRTWATAYLNATIVHDAPMHSDQLIASGPYRFVRNPLYLGTILMTWGMALLASRTGAVFLIVAMTLFQYRLILREEGGLLASQAESYARYLAAVPRLLPASTPRVPAGPATPQWGQAIGAEMLFWIFGLAELVFGITLEFRWFAGIMLISFASYFGFIFIMNRGKK